MSRILNLSKKWWHLWLRLVTSVIAVCVALGFIVYAIFESVDEDWTPAITAYVSGGTLLFASIGHVYTAMNEPRQILCMSVKEIKNELRKFIARGESAHVASERLSWLKGEESLLDFLTQRVAAGQRITVFASNEYPPPNELKDAGVHVVKYSPYCTPPRFTLLNMGRPGGAALAVARGLLPDHWIDIYDEKHHPQVIALARAYIAELEKST